MHGYMCMRRHMQTWIDFLITGKPPIFIWKPLHY